jgi:predicted nucleic acid-binding protein
VIYYADTSWWLALHYRDDAHYRDAIDLFARDPEAEVMWTPWQRVEVFNGLQQLERRGGLNPGDARRAIRRLEVEVRLGYWLHREFGWTNAVRRACRLSRELGSTMPIRGMDLFHVAVALTVRARIFLTFDDDQRALAQAARLRIH